MASISALLLVVMEKCWEGLGTLMVLNMLNSESVRMEEAYSFGCFLLRTKTVLNLWLGQRFYLSWRGEEVKLVTFLFMSWFQFKYIYLFDKDKFINHLVANIQGAYRNYRICPILLIDLKVLLQIKKLNMNKNRGKRMKKKNKTPLYQMIHKHEQNMNDCIHRIINGEVTQVIQKLRKMILSNADVGKNYVFEGQGMEQWYGPNLKGPLEQFKMEVAQGKQFLNPFDLLCICLRIAVYQKKLSTKQVRNFYRNLDKQINKRYQICIGLGNLSFNNSEYGQAQSFFLEAQQLRKTDLVHEKLVLSSIKTKNYPRTMKAIKYLSINSSSNSTLQDIFQVCYMYPKEYRKIEHYIGKYPSYYLLHLYLADILPGEAQRSWHLKKLLEKNPHCVEAHIKLAKISQGKQREMQLKKLLVKFPSSQEVWQALATQEFQTGNYEKSLWYYTKATKAEPKAFYSWFWVGRLNIYLGRYEQAREKLQKSLELNKFFEYGYLELATLLCIFFGDDEEAKKYFELTDWLLEGKKNKFFNESLYQFFSKNKLSNQAISYLQKVNQYDPTDSIVCTEMAEHCMVRKDFATATKWAKRACILTTCECFKTVEKLANCYLDINPGECIRWILEYACLVHVYSPLEYDKEMILLKELWVDRIPKQQLLDQLKKLKQQIKLKQPIKTRKNTIELYILADVFLSIDQIEDSLNLFHVVKSLVQNQEQEAKYVMIKRKLRVIFGDIEEGGIPLFEKQRFNEIKDKFEIGFKSVFRIFSGKK